MAGHYPVFLNVQGWRTLVVGGGQVAARKVAALAGCGAELLVVAPQVCQAIRSGPAALRERRFEPGDLDGVRLVISAAESADVNRAVAAEAKARGVLCNVADAPDLGDFIMPAVLRRGRLAVAVSTGGASPAAAREIRDEIGRRLGEEAAAHLDFLARARDRVKAAVADAARRRGILQRLAQPEVGRMIHEHGADAAEELLAQLLAGG